MRALENTQNIAIDDSEELNIMRINDDDEEEDFSKSMKDLEEKIEKIKQTAKDEVGL